MISRLSYEWRFFVLGTVFFTLFAVPASAQKIVEPTYERDIRPVFKKNCRACHNDRKKADLEVSGGLALDSFESIQAARHRKPGIFTGGEKSALLQRLTSQDDSQRMPQGGEALAAADIALMRRWLDAGLPRGEPATTGTEKSEAKSNSIRQRPVLFTTSFQTPKGFMGGFAPKLQVQLPHGAMAPITGLSYCPDGKTLAAGSYKQIVLWDLENAEPRLVLSDFPGAVHDLHFSRDGNLLLVAGGLAGIDGLAWIYDFKQSKWTKKIQVGQDVITGAAFDPGGRKVALANSDKKIYLCSIETGAIENTLTGHSDGVSAVAYTPDGESLLSVGKDRAFKVTTASTGRTKLSLSGSDEEELALAVHPAGKVAVSAGLQPSISWWELATGKRLRRLRGHVGAVNDMAFDHRGTLLASASSDKTVHLWNGKDGAPIRTLTASTLLFSVAVRPDGGQVAAGGFDGSTMIWAVPSGRRLLTLSVFRDPKGIVQWLAYIPEGFVSASPGARDSVVWTNVKNLAQSMVWTLLEKPNLIVQAAHGKVISIPGSGASDKTRPRGKP